MQSIAISHKTYPPSILFKALFFVIFLGLCSGMLFGQSATFTGRVTDPTGAVITKAQITVHNNGDQRGDQDHHDQIG